MHPIPTLQLRPVHKAQFANLNPQAPFPLESLRVSEMSSDTHLLDEIVFEACVTDAFVKAQVMPRGRPHWSLVHMGFIDDAIASATLTTTTGESYGTKGRYLETGFRVDFKKEGFMKGVLARVPRHSLEVDGYSVRWACFRSKPSVELARRGTLRVDILGVRKLEQVLLASAECSYLRANAV